VAVLVAVGYCCIQEWLFTTVRDAQGLTPKAFLFCLGDYLAKGIEGKPN
jgi:hypothetical protein